ncbi:hypothetical protein ACFQ9X_17750 [Catenulispora yoronensis]
MFRFVGGHSTEHAAGMCTRIFPSEGSWIDVCLFGSLHNFLDRIRAAEAPHGRSDWWSSSAPWIYELLESRGRVNTWLDDPDDYESIAMEILKVCIDQGMKRDGFHYGAPETRSFTLGHSRRAEFFASVFLDVTLTPERWEDDDGRRPYGAHRIMVGFPLWVRTNGPESMIVYTPEMRQEAEIRRQRDIERSYEHDRRLTAKRALEQCAPHRAEAEASAALGRSPSTPPPVVESGGGAGDSSQRPD